MTKYSDALASLALQAAVAADDAESRLKSAVDELVRTKSRLAGADEAVASVKANHDKLQALINDRNAEIVRLQKENEQLKMARAPRHPRV